VVCRRGGRLFQRAGRVRQCAGSIGQRAGRVGQRSGSIGQRVGGHPPARVARRSTHILLPVSLGEPAGNVGEVLVSAGGADVSVGESAVDARCCVGQRA
jgi:hypothetical protein